MVMPVRQMTQQEVRDWLGKGIVLSGIKLPKRLPQPTSDTEMEVTDNPKNGDDKWPAVVTP
jgi:hypothetical protein